MDTVNYILTLLFSTLGIGTIIIYLGKKIIDKFLDLGIEKFKSSLDRDLETHKSELLRQTEEFKAGLKRIELEHQIKYSRLHEERAQTIKKLYSLIIDLQEKLSYMTSMFQGPEWTKDNEREEKARESLDNFKKYFLENRIYFSLDLCNKIDEILNLSLEIIVEMSVTKTSADYDSTGSDRANSLKEWRKQNEKVTKEINAARLELEKEFRKLIGVE